MSVWKAITASTVNSVSKENFTYTIVKMKYNIFSRQANITYDHNGQYMIINMNNIYYNYSCTLHTKQTSNCLFVCLWD